MNSRFALIDCNNFFVSCERLFRPDLLGRAVVVLSSNDGCAVARSNEAKALGIKMGEPLHELKRRFTVIDGTRAQQTANLRAHSASDGRGGCRGRKRMRTSIALFSPLEGQAPPQTTSPSSPELVAFSANFELYGDISRRVAAVLARVTPRLELYSIDEAFLDISRLNIPDYETWGRALAAKIYQEVGIPVSVGIAPTKTLCKLAVDHAKEHPKYKGSFYIDSRQDTSAQRERRPRRLPGVERADSEQSDADTLWRGRPLLKKEGWMNENWKILLTTTPVHDIWGVGWRLAPRLRAEGIHTAADLAAMPPKRAQQVMGIHGRRMVAELNGIACIPLSSIHKPQQVISRGRQFGHDTNDIDTVSAAVARMANHACLALRREGMLATRATVWLMTNRKKPGYTVVHTDVHLYTPTADTGYISHQLIAMLERDFDTHHAWHKAEVTLWNLVPDGSLQTDVFGLVSPSKHTHSTSLMKTVDAINQKHGKSALRYASEDLSHAWYPRRAMQSPRYTASWQDLPIAKVL